MATVSFPGVFSGIDTDTLIAYAMASATVRLNSLVLRKTTWEEKISAVGDIEERVGHLQDLVDLINDASTLRQVTATTTDKTIVTVSASGGATEAVHSIVVNQLANAEKIVHDGVSPTETWTNTRGVASGGTEYLSAAEITATDYKFIFDFGDETEVTVDLTAYIGVGISLDDLVTEINTASQAASTYDAASVAEVDGSYHLRIEAKLAGANKDLTITDTTSVDILDNTDDFTETLDGDGDGTEAVVGAGDLVYTYDGVTRTIETSADTTLGVLRDMINNDAENPGVRASILDYDGVSSQRYHLVLTGNDTGTDYGISIDAGTDLSGFQTGDWTETQTAQDSEFRVDGYPPGPAWMSRSSNTITDVIPNVTITLEAAGSANVNLSRNTSALANHIENLVNIYNGLVFARSQYTGYDEDTKVSGVFQGDSTLNNIISQIRSILMGSVPGFKDGSDPFTLPMQLGIEIDRDGEASLDTSVLNDAITENYEGVLYLIGAVGRGASESAYIQFNSADATSTAGDYDVKVTFDASNVITAAYFRTVGEGEADWREATFDGYVITGGEDEPEKWVKLTITPEFPGTAHDVTGVIRVQEGFAGALYDLTDELLDKIDGVFKLKKDEYQKAITSLDNQIDVQTRRLEQKEDRLRTKYARMEMILAQLDAQRGMVDALVTALAGLGSSSSNKNT